MSVAGRAAPTAIFLGCISAFFGTLRAEPLEPRGLAQELHDLA
jgi:hypothetical protein